VGDGFPGEAPAIYALYRDRFYLMGLEGDELRLRPGGGKAEAFLRHRDLLIEAPWAKATGRWDDPRQFGNRTGFGAFVRPVIAYALGGTRNHYRQIAYPPAGEGHVQLFIVARSPDGFAAQSSGLGEHRGYVVYHVHLFRSEIPHVGDEP
jgi:hypothetical protein